MFTTMFGTEVYARHHVSGHSLYEEMTHGHYFKIALTFRADKLDRHSQAAPRRQIEACLRHVKECWQDATLNDLCPAPYEPTPEWLALWVFHTALEHALFPVSASVTDGVMYAEYMEE